MTEKQKQSYWEERAEQNADKIFRYSNRKAQLVTRWFSRASKEMDKQITAYYRAYAEKEQITLPQAKEVMTDRKALALTIKQASYLSERCPDDKVLQQMLDKAYTARAISREEFLKMQLQLLSSELYGEYADTMHKTLTQLFEESYYKNIFDYQQFVGFGSSFNRISTHQIEAAVTTAWKGKNYSERLWGDHRMSLARYLNRIITSGFIQGSSSMVMRAELQKVVSIGAYEARRLIRTESCQVSNRASLLAYREFGTAKFQFLATLDLKTSERCRDMDGKIFLTEKAAIGVNMPPLHPFCRSTTIPYVPNEVFDKEDTRTARGGDGRTYQVPGDMTYGDWYNRHVKGNPKELLAEQKLKHGTADAMRLKQYQAVLGKDAPKALDDFQKIKYTDAMRKSFMELDYRRRNRLQTNPQLALPMADQATAAEGKFLSYLFGGTNPDGLPKGAAITHRLGYDLSNWQEFRSELLRKAPLYPALHKGDTEFGARYEQKIVVNGYYNTPANLVAAWICDDSGTHLTSVYIKEV